MLSDALFDGKMSLAVIRRRLSANGAIAGGARLV